MVVMMVMMVIVMMMVVVVMGSMMSISMMMMIVDAIFIILSTLRNTLYYDTPYIFNTGWLHCILDRSSEQSSSVHPHPSPSSDIPSSHGSSGS